MHYPEVTEDGEVPVICLTADVLGMSVVSVDRVFARGRFVIKMYESRSRRIVNLVRCNTGDENHVTVNHHSNDQDNSDSYRTENSDKDYIPSTSVSDISGESLEIPVANKISLQNDHNKRVPSTHNEHLNNILKNYEHSEAFPFEYDNDFKDLCLFDDETMAKIRSNILCEVTPKTWLTLADEKETCVYESPYLSINKYKKTVCKFCEYEITSKHFSRHLERRHKQELQVKELLKLKPGSKEKKQVLSLIRNEGNLDNALRGKIIPKKRQFCEKVNEKDYAICKYCKGFYKSVSLSRHVKKCFGKPSDCQSKNRPLSESLVYTACHGKYGEILNKLRVQKEIFCNMQADEITSVAVADILIVYYGEDLLKRTKLKRSLHHISNKLRECAKFLIEMKKHDSFPNFLSILKPENFDRSLEAVKTISRFDVETRNFGAPSLALHFRTTLIALCDLASKCILRKKIPNFLENVEQTLTDIERFKNLVSSQWAIEIGSLALKDLNEKSATKPKLIPLTEDIMKLVKLVEKEADEAYERLRNSKDIESYRILSETVLVLTVLHNRKRVGDVQYLDWKSCQTQIQNTNATVQTELAESLTNNEKLLTQNYKRIVTIGKRSRPVTILIPKKIQKYFSLLCKLRDETWFPSDNSYFFTYPKTRHWIDGCSTIRKYASKCGAKHPELLTSCRLRKHIATVTQLLNLRDNEIDQLAKFMGHTTKTHESFYKLPQDVFQIAKVSKILQIMEKGNAVQFKNKNLEEIDIDMNEIEEENEDDENTQEEVSAVSDQYERFESGSSKSDQTEIGENSIARKGGRQKWTQIQKNIMKTHFGSQIAAKKALRKRDCDEFKKNNLNYFAGVSWVRIKTFIFNESRRIN